MGNFHTLKKDGLIVEYGLRYIKGNKRPYFFVTGNIPREKTCGAIHKEILEVFPDMADIVALHLRDDDGAPMYPLENGWYFYEGWRGGLLKHISEYQCFLALCKHLMLSEQEVKDLPKMTMKDFEKFIETLRPMWKEKADAVIKKYDLV